MESPDTDAVRDRIRDVADPDLGGDVVSLGLINAIDIDHDGRVIAVDLAFGAPFSPAETALAGDVREALADFEYEVDLSASIDRGLDPEEQVLPGVENVIAVASGKGGVGKSTVAVNLAAGLAELGARVGLFDADVYGPNVPRMVDANETPAATPDQEIIPPEQYGMKLMSMEFMLGEDDPVIWRGPMVHKVLTQLWEDVRWGDLDYMVVDLPPGTGDTQLTLLQSVPVSGAVIVTTPQDVALDDARKGLEMFGEHETPVLGIVENMSTSSANRSPPPSPKMACSPPQSGQRNDDMFSTIPSTGVSCSPNISRPLRASSSATSWGVVSRWSGCWSSRSARSSAESASGSRMNPGATTFARTPCGPSSLAASRTSASRPRLLAS